MRNEKWRKEMEGKEIEAGKICENLWDIFHSQGVSVTTEQVASA